MFLFPQPNGPYPIGTLTYHWVDDDRPEVFSPDLAARRELMVQVWYPASAGSGGRPAPYVEDAGALRSELARLHPRRAFLLRFILRNLKSLTSHAIPSAPVADDRPRYPVLIFLEGLTGYRQMNTFQVEQLVSQGYIVAALDQPYTAAVVVFPDGRRAALPSIEQVRPLVRQSYLPARPAPILNGRIFEDGIIAYLARDVAFTLDQLAALERADSKGVLTGRLDLMRAGVFGVSLGGIVAAEACRLEPRLRACLMMDAPMPTTVVRAGLQQPCMWITRDAETMRLERKRAGGWPEEEIEAHQTSMRAVFESLRENGYFVQVAGMFHINATDIPALSPLLPVLGAAGPRDARRIHNILNAYSLAFFDRHLQGQPAALLDGPSAQFPEVLLEVRRPYLYSG